MASKQTSQNFKFQYYIDMAKQKKIHWNVFVNLMEDLSYSNIDRLKYLNAILLVELTNSDSDMDRLKYLNVILMSKFKDSIEMKDIIESSEETEHLENTHDLDLKDETILEISNNTESIVSENERMNDETLKKFNESIQQDDIEISEINELHEVSQ